MEERRFMMLIGLAGSGKSTFAKEIMEGRDDIAYLSSDILRLELFGDENNQDNNSEVFNQMAIRTKDALKKGKHVIYDATNINRKKRKGLLQQLPKDVRKIAVYLSTDYKVTLMQNENRERVVPRHVIERMYKNMQIPVYSEGFDKITYIYDGYVEEGFPKQFTDSIRAEVLFNREGYGLITFLASYFQEFTDMYGLAHDSKYHNFSVDRHTYYVYKHIFENYKTENEKDRELLLWTVLLHDIGKPFTKSFINRKGEETRYANFISHEYVGSQMAVNFLKLIGFDDEFIYNVSTLIQFHLSLLNEDANHKKVKDEIGEYLYEKLVVLREADTAGH